MCGEWYVSVQPYGTGAAGQIHPGCVCVRQLFVIEISTGFSKPCKADVLLSGCALYLVSRQFE